MTTPADSPKNDKESLFELLASGDRRAMAHFMSLAESVPTKARRDQMAAVHKMTGRAQVIGLTGVPGSGKSTLVRSLAKAIRETGRKVGIVAIDPSSPFSGGAILGDRLRMTGLSGDSGVFIRSMATRGALGGLASATLDVVDVLDAAGFDTVLIETVGVGQDEVDIVQAAHTVIVVSAPGLGDDVQAIKAGVLEIADIHVVSKADRVDAGKTVAELKAMLSIGRVDKSSEAKGWTVPVVPTSAQAGSGVDDLLEAINDHRQHSEKSDEKAARKERILRMRVLKSAEDMVRQALLKEGAGALKKAVSDITQGNTDPHRAAEMLLATIWKK